MFLSKAVSHGAALHRCVRTEVRVRAQLTTDGNGNVKIQCPNAGKDFAAEEISALVLRKLVDDSAKFLNDKVGAAQCSGP